MKRKTEYADLTGEAPSRYDESMIDRLEYCRAVLFVHGFITADDNDEIAEEISLRRMRATEEYEMFAEADESEDV